MPDTELTALLPGEPAPGLPAPVAYAVAVRDLAGTEKLLRHNGFTLGVTTSGDIFLPGAEALDAAVIFRAATPG